MKYETYVSYLELQHIKDICTLLQRKLLYLAVHFAYYFFFFFFFAYSGFFCSVNHLSKTHIYLHEFKRSWFVIRDWWISICFVCFPFQGFFLCDRPVSGNNRLVKFALQILKIFLILVTCRNKATSASFLRQKIHSPSRFPSLFQGSLASFSAKLGEHVTL